MINILYKTLFLVNQFMILHTNFHLPILILLLKRSCTQDPKFQVVSNFFVYSDQM